MRSDNDTYDSIKPFTVCKFMPNANLGIGVRVSSSFHHHGLNTECVDVYGETVSINTLGFGGAKNAATWRDDAKRFTESIVEDLDKAIAELQSHRDRLSQELANLAS